MKRPALAALVICLLMLILPASASAADTLLSFSDMTFPGETCLYLSQTGLDLDAILDKIPLTISCPVTAEGLAIAPHLGAERVTFKYSGNTEEGVLVEDGWSTRTSLTQEQADTSLYVNYYSADGSWDAMYHGLHLEVLHLYSGNRMITLDYDNSYYYLYVQYVSSSGHTITDEYNFYGSRILRENAVSKTLTGYWITVRHYFTDTATSFALEAKVSGGTSYNYLYLSGSGWISPALEGLEDIDDAWVLANFPPTYPVYPIVPNVSFSGLVTGLDRTYTNLKDTNLDLDAIFARLPDSIDVTYDGTKITFQDFGSERLYFDSEAFWVDGYESGYSGSEQFGVWTIETGVTPDKYEGYGWMMTFSLFKGGWEAIYSDQELIGLTLGGLTYEKDESSETLTVYVDLSIKDFYDVPTGNLLMNEIYAEPYGYPCFAQYNSSGRLIELQLFDENYDPHIYTPGSGWDVLPAEYEEIDEWWIWVNLPSSVPGAPMPSSWEITLPADLTSIDAEAFSGTSARTVRIPGSVTTIGPGAFSSCEDLLVVYIPASVTSIASDAFSGAEQVLLVVESGSAAESFADRAGLDYRTR